MALWSRISLLVAAPAAVFVGPSLWSYSGGALPGTFGILGPVPTNVTRALPGCGACHTPQPGGNVLDVDVVLSARSLTPGQSITVTATATGGATSPLQHGGFCCDADAGTFSAGTGSQVGLMGRAITHTSSTSSPNRTWTYGYTAPTAPGPVSMFVNVNTVNGDGSPSSDLWAFHGGDALETTPTPVRMYVNAAGVLPVGDSCVGSWENYPVLGSRQQPTSGNANFAVELIGAAPMSAFVLLVGTPIPAFDLGLIGITGCSLRVNSVATLGVTVGNGIPKLSDGSAVVPLPIPAGVRGSFRVQGAFFDPLSGRPLPLTVTNALDVVIQ